MPGDLQNNTGKPYLRIVGGKIVQKVDKGTPKAKLREYELPNGTKGSKYELVYNNWSGVITNIVIKDTEYGEMCNIEFTDAILSLGTSSRYFQDFACKVFSGDIKQEFLLHPYDMEVDTGRKSGISVQQNGEKLKNYFYDMEEKKSLHGFPEVDEEAKNTKNYWKKYFMDVEAFLVEKIKGLTFVPQAPTEADDEKSDELDELFNSVTPRTDDLPF